MGLTSNISIKELKINGDSLGNASAITIWDTKSKILGLNVNIIQGTVKIVEIKGQLNTGKEKDNIDLDVVAQKIYLRMFARFVKDYISDLKGVASGNLHITGSFSDPVVDGKLRFQKTSFIVNYLNTQYNLSDEVTLTDKWIGFNSVTINDTKGNTAIASGKIYHEHFKDFRFDVALNAGKFQVLNTNSSQNNLYYGSAYVSGALFVKGALSNVIIDAAVKSERGTQIFIPLSNTDEVSQSDFITFVKHDTLNKVPEKYNNVDLSGITMNFDLEVTPDAEVQLIFDSKIGDIIKGRGTGNIKMEINTLGIFKMYGEYTIDDGDYLFTLQNIVNKRFEVEKGGTIRWNGNPYDAEINLNAVYGLRASLYDLLGDSTLKKRIPVECKLNMTNKLMNPTIKFGVEIPNIDDNIAAQVRKVVPENDEQENSNQVFSLLVLGRFATPRGLSADPSSGVSSNASELLSNQLSNWASHISKDVDIGFNYRSGDDISREEMELALSTQLFNDRVTVDGNVGVANSNTTQNTSNIVGDFNVDVKINRDGKLRVKGFNKSNNGLINSNTYTQGVGLFFREEFDTLSDLVNRYKAYFRKKKQKK
jgi:hypothetical protein